MTENNLSVKNHRLVNVNDNRDESGYLNAKLVA